MNVTNGLVSDSFQTKTFTNKGYNQSVTDTLGSLTSRVEDESTSIDLKDNEETLPDVKDMETPNGVKEKETEENDKKGNESENNIEVEADDDRRRRR